MDSFALGHVDSPEVSAQDRQEDYLGDRNCMTCACPTKSGEDTNTIAPTSFAVCGTGTHPVLKNLSTCHLQCALTERGAVALRANVKIVTAAVHCALHLALPRGLCKSSHARR